MIYDVIIIGGGPAGLAAADEAHSQGLSYHWLEQAKFLQSIEDTYPDDKQVLIGSWDKSFTEKVVVPFPMRDMSKQEFLKSWRSYVKKAGLALTENSRIVVVTKEDGGFIICAADSQCWQARHLIIAAGRISQPNKLGVPGESLLHVHYNLRRTDQYENQRILVVGGGDTAIEVALKLAEKNQVILSYRRAVFCSERLHPRNYEIIHKAVEQRKLSVLLASTVKKITNAYVELELPDNELKDDNWSKLEHLTLRVDSVFICIGSQKPALDILQSMTLVLNKKGLPEIMDGCCGTSIPNIYVIGDLRIDPIYKRGSIPKSVWEGQMVVKEIINYRRAV